MQGGQIQQVSNLLSRVGQWAFGLGALGALGQASLFTGAPPAPPRRAPSLPHALVGGTPSASLNKDARVAASSLSQTLHHLDGLGTTHDFIVGVWGAGTESGTEQRSREY